MKGMTANGLLMDVLNESDFSEEEHTLLSSRIPLTDLRYELDVRKYYRLLLGDNSLSRNSSASSRKHESKTVQTDPDTFNVPPSWLLEGEELVEELHTGLRNIINTMYHNPESIAKKDAKQQFVIDASGMKYFTYDNGYWQSKLVPSIRIPDSGVLDRQHRFHCYEGTERKLRRLLEVTAKLRNILPYVACDEPNQYPRSDSDEAQQGSTEQSSLDSEPSKSPCEEACLPGHAACDLNFDDDFFRYKGGSRNPPESIPEYCEVDRHRRKRVKNCDAVETLNKKNVTSDDICENQIPGVQVSRYLFVPAQSSLVAEPHVLKFPQQDVKAEISTRNKPRGVAKSTSVTASSSSKVRASCSTDFKLADKSNRIHCMDASTRPSREKHFACGQENCSLSKPHTGHSQKNFIKRNIVALKNKVNKTGSSVERQIS